MRARTASTVFMACTALVAVSCSESTPAVPSPSSSVESDVAAPISKQACKLQSEGDLIEWSWKRHPAYSDGSTGLPASAVEIGDLELGTCKSYLDGWVEDHSDNAADDAAGYRDCYELAWAKDNPGYNIAAVPAPRLKNLLMQAGNGC
jgi:hypothetical protein